MQRYGSATCEHCGAVYEKSYPPQRFCSRSCGNRAHLIPLSERFWVKVDKSGDCWLWTGTVTPAGYGYIGRGGRDLGKEMAHRVAYMLCIGPIPEGLVIDHLCRNRRCVNPAHLEVVTHRENLKRGDCPSWVAHRENRCTHGHELTPENTFTINDKWRGGVALRCRTCRLESNRRWQQKMRLARH